jgi:hypothetical protein
MILGFIGWTISNVVTQNSFSHRKEVKFSLYVNSKTFEGAEILAKNVQGQTYTNRDGLATLEFENTDSLVLEIKAKTEDFIIDTLFQAIAVQNFPKKISLFKELKSRNQELWDLIMKGVNDYGNDFSNLKGRTLTQSDVFDIYKSLATSENFNVTIESWHRNNERTYVKYCINLYNGNNLNFAMKRFTETSNWIYGCLNIKDGIDGEFNLDDDKLEYSVFFENYNEHFGILGYGPNTDGLYNIYFYIHKIYKTILLPTNKASWCLDLYSTLIRNLLFQ